MQNANLALKHCLIESFLFEDDNESKTKKVVEGLKKWLGEVKEKLKAIIKKFTDGVLNVFKAIKLAPSNLAKKFPITKAKRAEKLDREITEFTVKYEKLMNEYKALCTTFGVNPSHPIGKKQVTETAEKIKTVKAELDRLIEKFNKLNSKTNLKEAEGDVIEGKATEVKREVSTVVAKRHETNKSKIFTVYKKLSNFIISGIKDMVAMIGKLIKACGDIIKKGGKGIGTVVSTLGKGISNGFNYIYTNVKTFISTTAAAVKAGVISKSDKKKEA